MSENGAAESVPLGDMPDRIDALSLIKRAWRICFRSPEKYLGMAAVVGLPSLLIALIGMIRRTSERLSPERVFSGFAVLILSILSFILEIYMLGAFPVLTASEIDERPMGWTDAFAWVHDRDLFWGIFLVLLLAGLAVIGGLILLIIPGFIFGTWFMLSVPAKVLGDMGVTEALSTSKKMIQPRLFRGALALAGLLILPYVALQSVAQAVCSSIYGFFTTSPGRNIPPAVISYALHVFWAPVVGVSLSLLFIELSGGIEGLRKDLFL